MKGCESGVSNPQRFLYGFQLKILSCEFSSSSSMDLPPLEFKDCRALTQAFFAGDYHLVVEQYIYHPLLTKLTASPMDSDEASKITAEFITEMSEKSLSSKFSALIFGVSVLQTFAMLNWLGSQKLDFWEPSFALDCYHDLGYSGEHVSSPVSFPLLLSIAKGIFSSLAVTTEIPTAAWWHLRTLRIHNELLHMNSSDLKDRIDEFNFDRALATICTLGSVEEDEAKRSCLVNELQAQLHVEMAHIQSKFWNYKDSPEARGSEWHINRSLELLGMQFSLSAVTGKRTKFQTKSTPQLVMTVTDGKSPPEHYSQGLESLPQFPAQRELKSDHLLERPKLEGSPDDGKPLCALVKCLILTDLERRAELNKVKQLTEEEVLSTIERLDREFTCWGVSIITTFKRCYSEYKNTHKMERAVLQLEDLFGHIKGEKEQSELLKRLRGIFTVPLFPYTELLVAAGDLYFSLGLSRTAMEMYIDAGALDKRIQCLSRLGRGDEILEIVNEELEKSPDSPRLLCIKGDATMDPKYWERAWEVSGHKSARSQRALGSYWFEKKDFEKTVRYLSKALEINTLHPNYWFKLGNAAREMKNWDMSAKAFKWVVSLDDNDYQGWNNLASALMELDQKKEAYYALVQAGKLMREHPQIWYSILQVSLTLGEYAKTLEAVGILIDIKRGALSNRLWYFVTNKVLEGIRKEPTSVTNKFLTRRLSELISTYADSGSAVTKEKYENFAVTMEEMNLFAKASHYRKRMFREILNESHDLKLEESVKSLVTCLKIHLEYLEGWFSNRPGDVSLILTELEVIKVDEKRLAIGAEDYVQKPYFSELTSKILKMKKELTAKKTEIEGKVQAE